MAGWLQFIERAAVLPPTSVASTDRNSTRGADVATLRQGRRRAELALVAACLGGGLVAVLPSSPAVASPSAMSMSAGASKYVFTTLNNPADLTFNQLLGVNDFGEIAGYYGSGTPATKHPNKGYRLEPYSGQMYVNENYPGSQQTQVTAINDFGNTVGFYALPDGSNAGFLDEGGVLSSVSDPLTTSKPPVDQLLSINNHGKAAGFYNDAKGNARAFTWDRNTKVFTPVNPPGATSATATALNDNGWVAGFYTASNGNTVGFIKKGSSWKTIAVAGSTNTQILGMNDAGKVVGSYVGKDKLTHGFTYSGGQFRRIDAPGGAGGTVVNGVNNLGAIVGFYTDAKGNTDGFLADFKVVGQPPA